MDLIVVGRTTKQRDFFLRVTLHPSDVRDLMIPKQAN